MDAHIHKKMTLILTIIVAGATASLLLHTAAFSFGLFLLAIGYTVVVLIRDYVIKLNLHRKTGMLFLYSQLILALVVCVWSESFFAQIYILILIGEFTFHHSKNHAIIFTAISYVSILLGVIVYRDFPPMEQIYLIIPRAIEYFAIFGMSLLAKIAFQQKQILIAANAQLQAAALELEQKSILQERTRISKEIHDSVGHTLTSALAGLQTASHAIEKNNFSLAKAMFDRTIEYIRGSLDNVRSSTHLLRESVYAHKFLSELTKLIVDTQKQTHVEIEYDLDPDFPELTPKAELAIYRALQEGLTNGIRHGSSTYFHFSLFHRDHHIRFALSDNGKTTLPLVPGFGLKAMKERVQEVGGELSITKRDSAHGVTLEIMIPAQTKTNERNE